MSEAKKSIKIIVTHSGRQYVHQVLTALVKYGFSFKFFTSFWYKPAHYLFNIIKLVPGRIRIKIEKQLKKRYFENIPAENIFQYPYFEIIREMGDIFLSSKYSEYLLFYRDRIHDRWVAKKITRKADILIGYEECSMHTFAKAKTLGIKTVLDLAQIHYNEIKEISEEFPVVGQIYENKNLRKKIDGIKQKELELSDYIICLSSFAKQSLIKNGIPEKKIFIVNLGFDPFKFTPKINYSQSGKLKLVFAGTLTKRKGIDVILKVLPEIEDFAEITLIGPVSDAKELLENSKAPVRHFAYLEQEKMNEVFMESDIFIFPSYLDSWAMVVIEAMACGLPVIITENTGAKDAVERNGFIIQPGNANQLIEKITYFKNNRLEIERMGRISRKAAEAYTWENYHKSIHSIVEKISND